MWIFGTLVLLAVGVGAILYKQLVQAQNLLDEAWHDVENQINRRHGLIASLVEMIKEHNRKNLALFEGITKTYNQCIEASTLDERGKAETELSRQMVGLLPLAESRPELKTNIEFQRLKRELPVIESRIEKTVTSYNKSVRDFNCRMQSPGYSLLVKQFAFQQEDFFNMEYASQLPVIS